MRLARSGAALAAIAAWGAMTACGGSSDKSTGPGAGVLTTIVVTPDTGTIPIGATRTFTATGKDAQGRTVNGLTFFWSSHNDTVATVTQSGTVSALVLGTVQVAASAQNHSGFATVTVVPKLVGSIAVTPPSATIRIATTLQLQDTVKDVSGHVITTQAVTWSSDSSATVSVDGNGLITGRQLGTATITASAGGKSAKSSITVSQIPVKSITIVPTNPAVSVSQTTQLTATTFDSAGTALPGRVVRWTSQAPAVATIDSVGGLLTGVSAGSSMITATSEGVTQHVTATVSPAPASSVVLSPGLSQLHVGQTEQITATVTDVSGNPVTGATVTFSSNNTSIASITSTTTTSAQILTGPTAGTATITGTSGAKTGTATVIVTQVPVDSVNVRAAHDTLTLGHQDTLTATAFDSSGNPLTGRPVTWRSSNNAVATVNAAGIVSTAQSGTVVIFASISGVSGSVTILVNPVPVGSVTVSPKADTVLQGGQHQLTVVVRDSLGNIITPTVTWLSPLNSIATVTSSGLVTGVGPGTAPVIAQAGNKADTNTTFVPQPVASVIVAPATSTITISQTAQLSDTLKDGGGNVLTGRAINWSSNLPGKATVSQTGLVTPVDTGKVVITVTALQPSGNVTGTATVTITQIPVASVVVYPTPDTIFASAPGNTVQLHDSTYDASHTYLPGRPVTWSATGVAGVNGSGLATASGSAAGPATITATSADGPAGSASVVVLGHSQSDTITNLSADTLSATATVFPSSATANAKVIDQFMADVSATRMVTWTSSDPTTVTVNGGGSATVTAATPVTLTAVSTNTTPVTITVTAVDKPAATANVALTVLP